MDARVRPESPAQIAVSDALGRVWIWWFVVPYDGTREERSLKRSPAGRADGFCPGWAGINTRTERRRARWSAEGVHNQRFLPSTQAGTRVAIKPSVRTLVALILIALWPALLPTQAAPSSLGEFAFESRSGLLWVKVSVPQSAEPLNFLLDLGAGVSVINLRTAKRLDLQLGQRVDVRGMGSGTDGFWPQRLQATAGGVELPKECLAVDLAELSRVCECGVDGLLGADFFKDRVVQIDFGARKIRLLSSRVVTGATNVVKLKVSRGALLASVAVDENKPQWLRVDTGCTSALQWVTKGRKTGAQSNGVSVGLTELNIPAMTTTVKLGSMIFDSVPTGLHQQPIFSGEAGLLGNGLLTRFERITFDAKAGRLVLDGRRAGF